MADAVVAGIAVTVPRKSISNMDYFNYFNGSVNDAFYIWILKEIFFIFCLNWIVSVRSPMFGFLPYSSKSAGLNFYEEFNPYEN